MATIILLMILAEVFSYYRRSYLNTDLFNYNYLVYFLHFLHFIHLVHLTLNRILNPYPSFVGSNEPNEKKWNLDIFTFISIIHGGANWSLIRHLILIIFRIQTIQVCSVVDEIFDISYFGSFKTPPLIPIP